MRKKINKQIEELCWDDCKDTPEPCIKIHCREHLLWTQRKSWRRYTDEQILDILFSMNETCARKCLIKYGYNTGAPGIPFEWIGYCLKVSSQAIQQYIRGYDNGRGNKTPGALEKIKKKFIKHHLKDYWE